MSCKMVHERSCDICYLSAENPYAAVWNSYTNQRISMCSKKCVDIYRAVFLYKKEQTLEKKHEYN